MKRLSLLSAIALSVFVSSCKDNAASKVNPDNVVVAAERDSQEIVYPAIEFNETEHDFGEIVNGTPVSTVFYLHQCWSCAFGCHRHQKHLWLHGTPKLE